MRFRQAHMENVHTAAVTEEAKQARAAQQEMERAAMQKRMNEARERGMAALKRKRALSDADFAIAVDPAIDSGLRP